MNNSKEQVKGSLPGIVFWMFFPQLLVFILAVLGLFFLTGCSSIPDDHCTIKTTDGQCHAWTFGRFDQRPLMQPGHIK